MDKNISCKAQRYLSVGWIANKSCRIEANIQKKVEGLCKSLKIRFGKRVWNMLLQGI